MNNSELLRKLKEISAEIALGESTRLDHVQLVDDLVAEIQANEATEMALMAEEIEYDTKRQAFLRLLKGMGKVNCR